MTDHLPECPISYKCHGYVNAEQSHAMKMDYCVACKRLCICDALRDCEQRIREDEAVKLLTLTATASTGVYDNGLAKGYALALDAAEAAVAEVAPFDIPALLLKREEVIAAIRALKEKP